MYIYHIKDLNNILNTIIKYELEPIDIYNIMTKLRKIIEKNENQIDNIIKLLSIAKTNKKNDYVDSKLYENNSKIDEHNKDNKIDEDEENDEDDEDDDIDEDEENDEDDDINIKIKQENYIKTIKKRNKKMNTILNNLLINKYEQYYEVEELVKETYSDSDIDSDNINNRYINNRAINNRAINNRDINRIDKKQPGIKSKEEIDNIDINRIDKKETKKGRKPKEEIDFTYWINDINNIDTLKWNKYVLNDDKSSKYWHYTVKDLNFLSKIGKIDSKGSYLEKKFNNINELNKYIKINIYNKQKKGYKII